MPSTVFGLPAHVLVIHVVVVLLPLSALLAIAVAVSGRFRERYGVAVVALAFVATVAVPVAAQTGEALLHRLRPTPLIMAHARLGVELVPVAALFGLCLAAVVGLDVYRRVALEEGRALTSVEAWLVGLTPRWLRAPRTGRAVRRRVRAATRGAVVLTLASSLAVLTMVVLVGDAGARAVWTHYPGFATAGHAAAPAQGGTPPSP